MSTPPAPEPRGRDRQAAAVRLAVPTERTSPSCGDGVAAARSAATGDGAGHPETDRLLVTVPEVARLLHIGRRQAWEMVWRGELPVVRLGRSVRVARPVLERFVTERSLPYGE